MMNALLKNDIKEMNEVMEEQVTTFKVDSLERSNWYFRKTREYRIIGDCIKMLFNIFIKAKFIAKLHKSKV